MEMKSEPFGPSYRVPFSQLHVFFYLSFFSKQALNYIPQIHVTYFKANAMKGYTSGEGTLLFIF